MKSAIGLEKQAAVFLAHDPPEPGLAINRIHASITDLSRASEEAKNADLEPDTIDEVRTAIRDALDGDLLAVHHAKSALHEKRAPLKKEDARDARKKLRDALIAKGKARSTLTGAPQSSNLGCSAFDDLSPFAGDTNIDVHGCTTPIAGVYVVFPRPITSLSQGAVEGNGSFAIVDGTGTGTSRAYFKLPTPMQVGQDFVFAVSPMVQPGDRMRAVPIAEDGRFQGYDWTAK